MPSFRAFALALIVIAGVLTGCGSSDAEVGVNVASVSDMSPGQIRLPRSGAEGGCTPGDHPLRLGNGRIARLRVTPGPSKKPRGLILAFHGAGGSPREGLFVFREAWKEPGLVLLAPRSLGNTWSALHNRQDRDLETVNRALAETWKRCQIDRRRIAVGGFSDGATHALSIGLQNGGIFRSVMALSPGGLLDVERQGKPRVFIAHGTGDDVLPYSRSSKSIVPVLKGSGYSVTFRSFAGGHEVPTSISRAAVRWYLRR
ncbi:MAG: phospholipase [Actinobacteria bacterium]|nr:phospholipase [Actinomycetota bacterium]MBA3566102.1 phospholipase [Actinomycetota bacterium]